MHRRGSFPFALLLALLTPAAGLAAQCPDGSSPPCTAPSALEDGRWLVVPFDLAAGDAEQAWYRRASSHLLALELARDDSRGVVDDARVAAWLAVAQPAGGHVVPLATALGLARQGGAGHLVTGQLRVSNGTIRIAATVIATATGDTIRRVVAEAPNADAIFGTFLNLAQQLAGATEATAAAPAVGTTSSEAYRQYLVGLEALAGTRVDSARSAFTRATATDPTFALAFAGLARTTLQQHELDPALARQSATTAERLGAGLPTRERTLITIARAMADARYPDACRGADALIARDSADAEAWYLRGECHFHDRAVIREGTTSRFRSSWHQALRSFERATAIVPTLTVAYPHIPEMLSTFARRGCGVEELARVCPERWAGVVRLVGDSLRTLAFDVSRGEVEPQPPTPAAMRGMTLALAARELAAASVWFAVAPHDEDARLMLVEALLRNGDVARAAQEAAPLRGATDASPASIRRLEATVDAALKSGDAAAATQRLDEAKRLVDDTRATADLRTIIATRRAMLGQFAAIAALPQQVTPSREYAVMAMRVAAGLPGDSLERLVSRHRDFVLQSAPPQVASQLEGILGGAGEAIALGTPWPFARAAGHPTPMNQIARARAAGNADALARHLAALDELVTGDARPDINGILFQLSGEIHLVRGDSAVALARFRGFLDRLPRTATTVVLENEEPIYTAYLWGRGALATGDLAMAMGDAALARRAYQFVVALWARADAELQPAVTRARDALASLPAS